MDLRLGYLRFAVRDLDAWMDFCGGMLGLPEPSANSDGSLGWRVDEATQRLIVTLAEEDDLAGIGIDCRTPARLEAAVAGLRAVGAEVEVASASVRQARRVERLALARDPAGNAVELFCDLQQTDAPFASQAFPSGFHTGEAGLGHVVLISSDLDAMEQFYVQGLGFGVTERLSTRAGPVTVRGVFLHCNRRHHSIALFDLPSAKRLHHFMLQARAHMDVGCAFERARRRKVPLSLDLGQHPAPDGTFSFYGMTPSGFDFEIGAGSGEIDPAAWSAMRTTETSSWGHRPQWNLKWRMVSALLTHRLRKPRRAA